MTRTFASLVILLLVALALLASNRSRPLLVEARVAAQQPPPTPVFDLCPYEQPKDPTEIHHA